MCALGSKHGLKELCSYFEVSRSGYYKAVSAADRQALDETFVLSLVHEVRRCHPRLGGKKLYFLLKEDIAKADIRMGRDKFFELLTRHRLLVKRRRKYVSTTDSYHRFRVYRNLMKDRLLTGAHQCWVADITYIRTSKDFVYLFLITDAYSRKVVGWHLSDSLRIDGAVRSLQMAIRQRQYGDDLIHHSDRGIQYCSNEYTKLLKKARIGISMTEENHCYENAMAERVNGILKQEYSLDSTFPSVKDATKAVKEAINSYNMNRPHWSLNLATPQQVHMAA
nr:IS3 family transposase [Mucilaginibacter oryzae]